MATDQAHDVRQLIQQFTATELAIILAKSIHAQANESIFVDQAAFKRGPALIVSVSREGGEVLRIRAREKGRDDGYYLVYDANQCRDGVLWWSQADGAWFETHRCDQIVQAVPLTVQQFIAGKPEEATDGN